MIQAAGILFVVGETALFLRRGNGGDHPNEWCCPGGKMEEGEDQLDAAIRETAEEAGINVKPEQLRPWTRTVAPATPVAVALAEDAVPATAAAPAPSEDVDFTTFLMRCPEQFTPTLDLAEHDGYAWAPVTAPPEPLHPGVRIALERLAMDELGVARAMAAGQLSSPQKYDNMWLFAIRITGTGVSYRIGLKEFVWRDPSVYLNEEFLARCNGLQVIWEHPEETSLLNTKEHADRTIGAVFLPYIRPDKPDEVWAIAKIYDAQAAKQMSEEVLSTSPGVRFADRTANDLITLEDGRKMLIEGKPTLFDHIAICAAGVWDKGGEPTGVESITVLDEGAIILPSPAALPGGKTALVHALASALNARATTLSLR